MYIYLHKVTNERDVTIGTIFGNRTTKKEKDTIGMFVSTVAARVRRKTYLRLVANL
ncbi:condensation domain-containing protein [Paenibacillus elgii]